MICCFHFFFFFIMIIMIIMIIAASVHLISSHVRILYDSGTRKNL